MSPTHVLRVLLPSLVALALLLAPGAAASKYVPIAGAPAPGPSAYDEVFVDKHGPKNAGRRTRRQS